MTYTIQKIRRKWRVLNEVDQIVVTIEPTAGADSGDCKALATHLASMMNQMGLWDG